MSLPMKLIIASLAISCVYSTAVEKSLEQGTGNANKSGIHLEFGYNGLTGPLNWYKFAPTCGSGSIQTPINIEPESEDFKAISGVYANTEKNEPNIAWSGAGKLKNDGHTIKFVPDAGSYATGKFIRKLDLAKSEELTLLQWHIHTPSEHRVNGLHYPAEIHFVHTDNTDKPNVLAVVGAFFELGTVSDPFVAAFIAAAKTIPLKGNEVSFTPTYTSLITAIKNSANLYRYTGSLTTPGCNEGVKWLVADTTSISISPADFATIRRLIGYTAREIQPLYSPFDDKWADKRISDFWPTVTEADCVAPSLYKKATWWTGHKDTCCILNYKNKGWWTANFVQSCLTDADIKFDKSQSFLNATINEFGETMYTSNFIITRLAYYKSDDIYTLDRRAFKVYSSTTGNEITNLPGFNEFDQLANVNPGDGRLKNDKDNLFIVNKTHITVFKATDSSIVKQTTLKLQREEETVDQITVRNSRIHFVGYIMNYTDYTSSNAFYQYDFTTGNLVAQKVLEGRFFMFGFSPDGTQIYAIEERGEFWKCDSTNISTFVKLGRVPIDEYMAWINTQQGDELACTDSICYATVTTASYDDDVLSMLSQLAMISISSPGSPLNATDIIGTKLKVDSEYGLDTLHLVVSKTGLNVFVRESKIVEIKGDGYTINQYFPYAGYLYKFDFNGKFVKSYDMTYQNAIMENFAISDDETYMWRSNQDGKTQFVQKLQL